MKFIVFLCEHDGFCEPVVVEAETKQDASSQVISNRFYEIWDGRTDYKSIRDSIFAQVYTPNELHELALSVEWESFEKEKNPNENMDCSGND